MAKQAVTLPYRIKVEAEHFADEEVGQTKRNPSGTSRNSPEWKKAFNRYVREAYEHSLVPSKNNPGTPKVSPNIVLDNYPEIWGPDGFIAKVSKSNNRDSAEWKAIDGRIRGAIGNLFQMYIETVLGFKIKRDKDGKINDKATLSVFEFASKEGKSVAQNEDENMKTIFAQYYRYLIEEILYELLIPLLSLTKEDVSDIMKSTGIGTGAFNIANLQMPELRSMFVTALRNRVKAETKGQILTTGSIRKLFLP